MSNKNDNIWEEHLRFVAKHYQEERLDANHAWTRFAAERPMIRRSLFHRYWMGTAAAVLLVLVGITTLWWNLRPTEEWVVAVTRPGQYLEICLPDSSWVSLAARSSVRYDRKSFGRQERRVEMQGKAFFQVRQDETHPFSVQTTRTCVTVLGTSFQVATSDTAETVHVVTGKVDFKPLKQEKGVVLTAGMSAVYADRQINLLDEKEQSPNDLAWKTKQLHFDETPLDQVMNEVGDCYQVKIQNRSAVAGGMKLTATFRDLSLDEVLEVINQTLGTRLEVVPDK